MVMWSRWMARFTCCYCYFAISVVIDTKHSHKLFYWIFNFFCDQYLFKYWLKYRCSKKNLGSFQIKKPVYELKWDKEYRIWEDTDILGRRFYTVSKTIVASDFFLRNHNGFDAFFLESVLQSLICNPFLAFYFLELIHDFALINWNVIICDVVLFLLALLIYHFEFNKL